MQRKWPAQSYLDSLRADARIRDCFRYRLRPGDFHTLHEAGRRLGAYAVKPLYARLHADGRVDRTSRFSGTLAILFIPADARRAEQASLLFAHLAPSLITDADGKRNWRAIRAAARAAIRAAGSARGERRPKNRG